MLEQKIKNTEEKKSKEPWELRAKDFIPIVGLLKHDERMRVYRREYAEKISQKRGVSLKEIIAKYSFRGLPQNTVLLFYNGLVIETATFAGYLIYQQF